MKNNLKNYRVVFLTILFLECFFMSGVYFYKQLSIPVLSAIIPTESQTIVLSALYVIKLILLIFVIFKIKSTYKIFILISIIIGVSTILYEKMNLLFILVEGVLCIIGILSILCSFEKIKVRK
ncbi:hypothetical protein [Clostridium folliculivorans]|uniref:Uncharacterized protein n=1 Tax=Clostridium folliculivorans TaxID=2886038 RepID=A0A9W5XYX4_9CLOT|nr:hypothetical protein [Clostridium folliculivorans]GKU23601.1 hypothetical protein CFOLD11_04270 [Clostridium folliculivorans]GKU29717.1 hypothetical protein CFB3_18240 [Clostridium folliculivorans]